MSHTSARDYKFKVTQYSTKGASRSRKIKFFRTRAEADVAFAESCTLADNDKTAALNISVDDRDAVLKFLRRMETWNKPFSVAHALEYFVKNHELEGTGTLVADAVAKRIAIMEALLRAGQIKKRHADGTRCRLERFARDFEGRRLHSLTSGQLYEWCFKQGNAVTAQNFKLAISPLFKAALKPAAQGMPAELSYNPLDFKIHAVDRRNEIFTPEEAALLLAACPERSLPALAVWFFAGLRRAELLRLQWSHFKWKQGMINLDAENTKTAAHRSIAISPNLAAWLRPYGGLSQLAPREGMFRVDLEAAAEASGVKWKHNACRHSFVSYRLAIKQDSASVALEAGHTTAMLHRHYKNLVSREEAEQYFAILPPWANAKAIQTQAQA